jgi:hypothetical protein
MLDFSWFLNAFSYVVLRSIANDVAPLLVGGVNICDNQPQKPSQKLRSSHYKESQIISSSPSNL